MKIIIVPYRDRLEHKTFFLNYLDYVVDDYELLFIQQCDVRPFNRGAMKNIGFLAVKAKYPETYRDITLVFNDVDIMPYTKNVFRYETTHGVVQHNYGYRSCLSASFAIKGGDFEKTNGFPNLWAWGLEDYMLQERVLAAGIRIERGHFQPVGSRKVLQLFDGIHRMLSPRGKDQIRAQHARDGISSLRCTYAMDGNVVNVTAFTCLFPAEPLVRRDIRQLGINLR